MKVKITKERRKKEYLTDVIGDDYLKWRGKKIFITAPTGMGKSTFIIEKFLNSLRIRKRRLLLVCNRRLLRLQYWAELLQRFDCYEEMEKCVVLTTYQSLAEKVKRGEAPERLFQEFDAIVCDECHYFYADSDFNTTGTYVLMQVIARAGSQKTMIFMSATMKEAGPLIERTLRNCMCRQKRTGMNRYIDEDNEEILHYDFSRNDEFGRFRCVYAPDMETICRQFVRSQKKSVIFVDDKTKGAELVEQLLKTGEIERQNISVLNADNIDTESELVRTLAVAHRIPSKILITTSVLDNGVSINDAEVENVLIMTESRVSFIQMLGRIRSESVDTCNLYFVQRDYKVFQRRMQRYEKERDGFRELTTERLRKDRDYFIQTVFDSNDGMADFYRKALAWIRFDNQFYVWPETEYVNANQRYNLCVNEFAKHKIEDMYLAESRFYTLASEDPLKVVYAQMAWIGKKEEELHVLDSEYRKIREQDFIESLLSVQSYSAERLKIFKSGFVKTFRKEFFADVPANNGTLDNRKLEMICRKYGMIFVTDEDRETRKKVYSVMKIHEEEQE